MIQKLLLNTQIMWMIFTEILKNTTQKITNMSRRWGTPQNYPLAFIDELEKHLFNKKTVEVDQ